MPKISDIQRILFPDDPSQWDGKWGNRSQGALDRLVKPEVDNLGLDLDPRSEEVVKSLHPKVQPIARRLVHLAKLHDINIVVTSGFRTYPEQDELYNRHDGTTHARGGYSNHNFGLAFDVTIFNVKQPIWESPLYEIVGQLGKKLGLFWGGDWASIRDEPHFELRPDWAVDMAEAVMITELRRRKTDEIDYFA